MDQFNFLYMAAISLPSETDSQKVLKSFYLTKSKELFGYDRTARNLKFNPTRTCSRCNSLWSDGGCSITFKERRKGKCKSKRKCRQLISKYYKYGMPSGRFSRMSKFMAKKLCRQVTFQCTFCDHKQIFYMRPKLRKIIGGKKSALESSETADRKRKKFKSKTRFAGLDQHVMKNLQNPVKDQVKLSPLELKIKEREAQKLKKQKKRLAQGKVTKVEQASSSTSAKSRALSKNNMMQLALLLKNKDNNSSSTNRLEMLFKK